MRELALFAGAGGGILGGKLLGWRTVCAVELEPYAASVPEGDDVSGRTKISRHASPVVNEATRLPVPISGERVLVEAIVCRDAGMVPTLALDPAVIARAAGLPLADMREAMTYGDVRWSRRPWAGAASSRRGERFT